MTKSFLIIASLVIGITGPAPEHGIEVEFIRRAPSVIATFSYSGGGPVKNVDVVVFRPGEGDDEYQRGRTDANGVFAFVPDAAGRWRVTVDDGYGHREEAATEITEEFLRSGRAAFESGEGVDSVGIGFSDLPLWLRTVWGLSIIFCIACLFYLVKIRKLIQGRTDQQ